MCVISGDKSALERSSAARNLLQKEIQVIEATG